MYFRHHHRRHPLLWLGAFLFLGRLMRRRFGPYGGWYGAPYGRHGRHGHHDPYYF